MAARAGVEPTALRLKAIDSTKAPPCPTIMLEVYHFATITTTTVYHEMVITSISMIIINCQHRYHR